MSDAAVRAPAPVTRPAGPRHRSARRRTTDPAVTARRWAIGVLAAATLALAGLVALLVAVSWFFIAAWAGAEQHPGADLLAIARDLAPVLLVGWCVGLAASAVLSRGEALGPRLAGVTAGVLGTASGAAVLALTGTVL